MTNIHAAPLYKIASEAEGVWSIKYNDNVKDKNICLGDIGWNKNVAPGNYTLTLNMSGKISIFAANCNDRNAYFKSTSAPIYFFSYSSQSKKVSVTAKDFSWTYDDTKATQLNSYSYDQDFGPSDITIPFIVTSSSAETDLVATVSLDENQSYYDIKAITCNSATAKFNVQAPATETEFISVISNKLTSAQYPNYASGTWTLRIDRNSKAIQENATIRIEGFQPLINNSATFSGFLSGNPNCTYTNYQIEFDNLAVAGSNYYFPGNVPFEEVIWQNLFCGTGSQSGKRKYDQIKIIYSVLYYGQPSKQNEYNRSLTFSLIQYPSLPKITNDNYNSTYYNAIAHSLTCPVGTIPTLAIGAVGESISYQWYKNNVAIAGATTEAYTTPAITSSDNGAIYYCKVTNAAGTAQSTSATVKVCDPPNISGYLRNNRTITLSAGNDNFFPLSDKSVTGIYINWGDNSTEQKLLSTWVDLKKPCRSSTTAGCFWPTVLHTYSSTKTYPIKITYEFSSSEAVWTWVTIYTGIIPIPVPIKGWKTSTNRVLVSENTVLIPSLVPIVNLLLND